jgi:crotonobetainyl-CoA:carnitine CoA-transferase CaiB-like acyl-CoA transferase
VGFLDGVKVIDVTRLLPGGYCTMLLSDMGAEVVKVEEPGLGDYMRATPPTKDGRSPVHSIVNRNKTSIGIDLKKKEGREVLRRLVKRADVFVEGFRPGAIGGLGFSFQSVRKLNPRVVYCSISAFGQKSWHSSMPGHDINFEAMAGTLSYSHEPEAPLMQFGDIASGMFAALAIVGAILKRKKAVHIDVPIVPSLLATMVLPVSSYLATGKSPSQGDSLVFGSDPYYNIFRTSDNRYIAVAAIEQRFWHNLVTALGVPELEELRFGGREERRSLTRELKRAFASRTRDQWSKILMGKEIVLLVDDEETIDVGEALKSDWARAASMLVNAQGELVLNNPVKASSRLRSKPFTRAPSLGEQTDPIMKSLGYSRAEVAALRRSGAIE